MSNMGREFEKRRESQSFKDEDKKKKPQKELKDFFKEED